MRYRHVMLIVCVLLPTPVFIRFFAADSVWYDRHWTTANNSKARDSARETDVVARNSSHLKAYEYIRSNLEFIAMVDKDGVYLPRAERVRHGFDFLYRNSTIPVRYADVDGSPASDSKRGRITVAFHGRLGNNMYQYSALYAAAVRHGMRIVLPGHIVISTLFKLNATVVKDKRPGRDWMPLIEYQRDTDPRLEHLDPTRDIELVGPYRSLKYWHTMVPEVRRQFTFVDDVEKESTEFVRKV